MTPQKDPVRALAGRVDRLEVVLDDHEARLKQLKVDGDAMAVAVRMAIKAEIRTPPGQRNGTESQEPQGTPPEPNWLRVTHEQEARGILSRVTRFVDHDLQFLVDSPPAPCWPWHPRAVVNLSALERQYTWAYKNGQEKVSDFQVRWLRALVANVADAMTATGGKCSHKEHWVGEDAYRVDVRERDAYASWWASGQKGEEPGVTPMHRGRSDY